MTKKLLSKLTLITKSLSIISLVLNVHFIIKRRQRNLPDFIGSYSIIFILNSFDWIPQIFVTQQNIFTFTIFIFTFLYSLSFYSHLLFFFLCSLLSSTKNEYQFDLNSKIFFNKPLTCLNHYNILTQRNNFFFILSKTFNMYFPFEFHTSKY